MQPESNQPDSRSVHQMPPVRFMVVPTDIIVILPEDFHFVGSAVFVPKTVSQQCTRSRLRLDEFQHDARFGMGLERFIVPVSLRSLLPGDDVKMPTVLVGKDEAHEIIVTVILANVEGSFVVDAGKFVPSFVK